MPKKPNSHGQDQEYVPAGNGDASGEYADDSGSNKGFKSFKAPGNDGEISKTGKQKIDEMKQATRLNDLDDIEVQQNVIWTISNALFREKYSHGYKDFLEEAYEDLQNMGYFKDLTREEFDEIVDLVKESQTLNNEYWYEEDGVLLTNEDVGLKYLAGETIYDKEEAYIRNAELRAEREKEYGKKMNRLVTKEDKQIKACFGEKTVVAFGRGYSKEMMDEILDATKTLTSDFGDLKDFVKYIGDNKTLSKYNEYQDKINADEYNLLPKFEEDEESTIAYWSKNRNALVYNSKSKHRSEYEIQYNYDDNYFSSDKRIGTYYHEMGHAIDSLLTETFLSKKAENNQAVSKIKEEFSEKFWNLANQNLQVDMEAEYKKVWGKPYYGGLADDMRMDEVSSRLVNNGVKPYKISRYADTNSKEFVAECFSAHYSNMDNELATQLVNLYKDTFRQLKEL